MSGLLFIVSKCSVTPLLVLCAIVLLSSMSFPTPAEANLRMCNKTEEKVSVAIGYRRDSNWVSEGWWNLEPLACEVVRTGPLTSRYYYVYATDFVQSGIWGGSGYMCVQNREFTIFGIDDCVARGYQRRGFFEIDTGNLNSWTIQLTETVGAPGKIGIGGP